MAYQQAKTLIKSAFLASRSLEKANSEQNNWLQMLTISNLID
jgi:hypothetical protein